MFKITKKEKDKLYRQVKHELGYPKRKFELDEEMLNTYLEMVIEDYSALLNKWLVEQQWVGLQGIEIDETNFTSAFLTKSNDFIRSFTYAYSKQVGLGTNTPAEPGWELKRDYITTTINTQHYIIPANREINEVLWETPPSIDQGLVDPFALGNFVSGQMGWSYLGRPAMYVQPTYSLLLAAQDRRMKQRILQSELTYRITGLESGEKILHLYPVPGGRSEIRNRWGKHYAGRKVWYWYYDTKSKRDKNSCLKKNKDIVRLPSDPILDVLTWDQINSIGKQQIRNLLIAKTKVNIGGIRGYFSGSISPATERELQLDYRHLLDEGEKLKEDTEETIKETLDKLSLASLTEERANIAENVNRAMGYQPPRTPLIAF